MKGGTTDPPIVESVVSHPWSSLTFCGERHRIVVRVRQPSGRADLPGGKPVDGADLAVAGAIIAVEQSAWLPEADGLRLTVDLIAIAAPERCDNAPISSRMPSRRALSATTEPASAA